MRIKEPFAQERLSEEKKYRAKYFIASEGQTTEPRYFDKLNQSNINSCHSFDNNFLQPQLDMANL